MGQIKISTKRPENGGYTQLQILRLAMNDYLVQMMDRQKDYIDSGQLTGSLYQAATSDNSTVLALHEKLSSVISNLQEFQEETEFDVSSQIPAKGGNTEWDVISYALNDYHKKIADQIKDDDNKSNLMESSEHSMWNSTIDQLTTLIDKLADIRTH